MTHRRQDCLERPRKKGAKFTNKNIARDEIIQHIEAGYDAKRDRWNGYDPAEHKKIYEEYEAVETERQRLREEEIDKQTTTDMAAVRKVAKAGKAEGKEGDADFGSSDEEDADEDKYADAADAVGQKMDTKTRITVRNLRIREDTAKYLINLDPSSAYYDPKTRSMRDNPLQDLPPEEVRIMSVTKLRDAYTRTKAKFAGDNFLRYSGDAPEVQELQLFAWQSEARGNDVHLNANPTQGQLLHEAYKEKKEELRDTSKVSVLAKYGGEEHLAKPPKELLLGQTEEYVEYSRAGQVIHGKERAKARSKYPEDGSFSRLCLICYWSPTFYSISVYVNNHTSVWGSWYDTASSTWGYACCHSTVHISYCTGDAGRQAAKASSAQILLEGSGPPPEDSRSKSPPEDGGGDNGKQRKTGINVEAEQSKLSDERKRKARANDGDERFSKKSKDEEAAESKKFDVSEDELGMDFVQDGVGMVNANEYTQRDTAVRGVEWRIRWRTTLMAGTCSI
jgi:pre-mRNA-processing factor SLU7